VSATIDIFKHALTITSFVAVMMLVVEYLNVWSRGRWQSHLAKSRWGQYLLAAFLGATPGCLGAFAVVGMYAHGSLTHGAAVAAMIATMGDEAFVMLAVMPKQALLMLGLLFVLGIGAGALTDIIARRWMPLKPVVCDGMHLHTTDACQCFPRGSILRQWRGCSATRGILAGSLALFILGLASGQLGPPDWNWIRVTLLAVSAAALFVVATVPDHFLDQHLWNHVVRKHVPRILLWTLGALVAMHLLASRWDLGESLDKGRWLLLLAACLLGLVPESGPHLVFVTLYVQGTIPLSILLASSIVQDGHGMLPMLAHSRKAFLGIKAVNLLVGLLVGGAALAAGW
jgi:hypothetical protein